MSCCDSPTTRRSLPAACRSGAAAADRGSEFLIMQQFQFQFILLSTNKIISPQGQVMGTVLWQGMATAGIPGLGAAAAPRDLPPSYGIDAMLGDMQVQIHETTEFASAYTLGQWIVLCKLGRGLMFAVACSRLCGLRSQKSVRLRQVVRESACSRD